MFTYSSIFSRQKLPANNSLQNKLKVRTRVREKITGTNYGNHGVYLNHEKEEYPVHRIIIKIISYLYSPHEPNQHQEKPKERHLYIAIVIHNELYPPRNTLCRVNMCGLLGWHVASLEGGLVYCCSLDDLPDLVMQEDIRVDYKPFNLNEILPKGVHPPSPPVEVAGKRFTVMSAVLISFLSFFHVLNILQALILP